jgi:hypothetical protein
MDRISRGLVLGFSFVGEQLRRLPGARRVQRFAPLVVATLLITALIAGGVWGAQKSPQRISLAELAVGALAPMQSWIIVSGDVATVQSVAGSHRYVLTDPEVPGARLYIASDVELPVGPSTVSGKLIGGDARAPQGYDWTGHLNADPVLAHEQEPPWISIGLIALAVLVGLLALTSYPVFFRDDPARRPVSQRALHVGVRSGWSPKADSVRATLTIDPGKRVRLDLPGGQSRELLLHSAKSSIEVGRFQRVNGSEPVLLLVASGGDVALSFEGDKDRDLAYNALAAAAAMPLQPQ